MLARYPKLNSAIIRNPIAPTVLPPLCIEENSGDWVQPRGCDSAPVVPGQSKIFFRDQKADHPSNSWPSESDVDMSAVSPEMDLKRLSRCVHLLQQSGYYYEGLSWQQASSMLKNSRVGTFIVRDSENANYLFTLSVQTKKGPTSIRIAYRGGYFRLDCEEELVSRMPVFETVTNLVEYYVGLCKDLVPQKETHSCCWLDLAGEYSAPVEIYFPLYSQVNSLKHTCRLKLVKLFKKNSSSVEKALDKSWTLGLPLALVEYIKEYPHCH